MLYHKVVKDYLTSYSSFLEKQEKTIPWWNVIQKWNVRLHKVAVDQMLEDIR